MQADIKTILSAKGLDVHGDQWLDKINSVRAEDVERELKQRGGKFSLERLVTFVSPAAGEFIEEMAQQAHRLTVQRFGRAIQLYAPLYVSNFCLNSCRYCGYNRTTDVERTRLSVEEALGEADIIASEGFRHILIVSGEDPEFVTVDYLSELAAGLRSKFCSVSMEIFPMSEEQYVEVFAAGIDGVTLYQETYDKATYAEYHTAGPKSDYDHRLGSAERFASAGMRRIGLGVLLGLSDWRLDTLALAEHAAGLMKRYWRGQVSFSFPRLRPALNVQHDFEHLVSDAELVQMMLALRLCFADAGIVLSTRESAALRDNLIKLCVTRMSAGSKTSPGGYSGNLKAARQFEIDDGRSPAEVAEVIRQAGCEAVWKDWDAAFMR
jgi:2-iminoacetate synthase